MRISLLFALLIFSLIAPHETSAQAPATDIDVLHYAFQLDIRDGSDAIKGETAVTLRFLRAGVDQVVLNLVKQAPGSGKGMQVQSVREGSLPLSYVHQGDELKLTLPSPPDSANEVRTYVISYTGIPADGLIISQNQYGDRTFFGDNWPNRARHWLPTVDHPSDKATCEFIVTSPDRYEVIANGYKVEESDLDATHVLTHWRTDVPLPTKVMVFGAARFAIEYLQPLDGVSVQSWIYPQDRQAGFHDYSPAREILSFFSTYIGPYPFEKLANVQSTTRYGGMENASNIFYAESSVTGQRTADALVAHEIAHQWFGNSATEADWPHIWLSESFATYFTHLWIESTQGRDSVVRRMKADRAIIFRHDASAPGPIVVSEVRDPNRLLNPNSYEKGGWVLHMLRFQVGEEAFHEGIRRYYATYQRSNARTEDFRAIMETVSGQDLATFFQQWLYRPGHPVIEGTMTYDAGRKKATLRLRQTQPGPAYQLPLEIALIDAVDKQVEHKVSFSEKEQTFTFPSDTPPNQVIPDPNSWLLLDAHPIK